MRIFHKYIILLLSLAIYTWFVGYYVLALLGIAGIVIMSYQLPKQWNLLIPLTCLIIGFILMKYMFASMSKSVPIGYSVFAFNCISFLVDYSKVQQKEKVKIMDILCYLFFFPKMLCGPIVRFLPFQTQINNFNKPSKNNLYRAFKIGVYAAFCKFGLADNISWIVSGHAYGINAWLSAIVFALQLYLDFFAYSNFAIAFAVLFGIDLPHSFNSPYRAFSFRDFWKRWNITISEWLRDYVYIPLGGSRNVGKTKSSLNIMATFLVSGLWHGATLPFILWGAFHGLLVIGERPLLTKLETNYVTKHAYRVLVVLIVAMLWQLFRLENIGDVTLFLGNLFTLAPMDLSVLAYTIIIGITVWFLDRQACKKLVFTTSEDKQFVYKEVSLVCIMFMATIVLLAQPSINFFYFKF